eukprot:4445997-Pyramimonas_sp.AAC.1
MARIQAIGLTPSVLHGAAVMGVADHVLRPVRALAGALAGAKTAASLATALVIQPNPKYDPMLKATMELPYMYASDAKLSLTRLQCGWQVVEDSMGKGAKWSK